MAEFKIGVIIESFRTSFDDGLRQARELGADGIQVYATRGEISAALTPAERRELLDKVRSSGLVFSALCGDFGGHGFTDPADNPDRIEKSKRILELARDLDTTIVTTHIGVLPSDPNHPRYKIMQEACAQLAEFGDSIGASFAIETGPEPASVLRPFLDSLGAKGLCVNFDPANLAMVLGEDAAESARILAPYIVHTHAKDGIRLYEQDPEIIYGLVKDPAENPTRAFLEVPLGEGAVNFPKYLRALDEIGYSGFLTIEREVGDNPAKDIRLAVDFLRKTIAEINQA